MRVAIDTGGTFTDCVYLDGGKFKVLKLFSTPNDPSLAVLTALDQIGMAGGVEVRHGTTIGTNAMLERKGARVAFITTAGFEDTIAIGRQTRAKLYDWLTPIPVCLVPRKLRFGVRERVNAQGQVIASPSGEELDTLVGDVRASGAEAVAISLLFSFANPETELRIEAALQSLGVLISTSHRILPEFREYERAATIVVNAYLAPKMQDYLLNLEQKVMSRHTQGRVDVMQSSGGLVSANLAAREPVRTVLSGPAGGVIGACQVARWAGYDRIVGLDMGGTSTDVFLADAAQGGKLTTESTIAGVPLGVPMLDIHTVGAGGGSMARFDAGGMLRVGPESAGSEPGPICFGRGTVPTVTDANLLLGRLDPDSFLGGGVRLDRQRAHRIMSEQKGPLATAEQLANGILRVVETQMEKAVRLISVERGQDPRELTLVAFGGGGPLHACSLARALRIPRVLIPVMPGALSAMGILLADFVRDYSCTVMLPGGAISGVDPMFAELEERGSEEFTAEGMQGAVTRTIDVRYRMQGYELNVGYDAATPTECIGAFHRLHQERYGFSDVGKPVEIVNLRLRMIAAAEQHAPARQQADPGDGSTAFHAERQVWFEGKFRPARIYRRDLLRSGDVLWGPAMITEYTSATVLPPEHSALVDPLGNILITCTEEVAS